MSIFKHDLYLKTNFDIQIILSFCIMYIIDIIFQEKVSNSLFINHCFFGYNRIVNIVGSQCRIVTTELTDKSYIIFRINQIQIGSLSLPEHVQHNIWRLYCAVRSYWLNNAYQSIRQELAPISLEIQFSMAPFPSRSFSVHGVVQYKGPLDAGRHRQMCSLNIYMLN